MKIITILLIVFILNGCKTFNPAKDWPDPKLPTLNKVEFKTVDQGLYLDYNNSQNLLKNMNELDAYIEKMQVLVKEMKQYYGDK